MFTPIDLFRNSEANSMLPILRELKFYIYLNMNTGYYCTLGMMKNSTTKNWHEPKKFVSITIVSNYIMNMTHDVSGIMKLIDQIISWIWHMT